MPRLFVHRLASLAPAILLTLVALPRPLLAQSDDFNDGNDIGWTRFDLRIVGAPSTYSFPADGSGGRAYRFFSPAPSVSTYGPARTLSYRADLLFTNFTVAVDLLAWDNRLDQGFAVFARATNIGLGRSRGYMFNYNPHQYQNLPVTEGELQVNRVNGEVPLTIARAEIYLDPARKYRLVGTGFGSYLVGKIYDLTDLSTPLATVDVIDTNFAAGSVGLLAFSRVPEDQYTNSTSNADVTFDNFFASGSAPTNQPPPSYRGPLQLIDSSDVETNTIDDFTDHTYRTNGLSNGAFADATITRLFPRAIKSINVTIVTGHADDIGYVGDLLVTPESAALRPCTPPGFAGFVVRPMDVTSQVSTGLTSATLVLRALQNCGVAAGWGSDTLLGRANARLHWQVELAPPNHPPLAVPTIFPLFHLFDSDTNFFVLATNDESAFVVFDGSSSSDVDGGPLQYSWFDAQAYQCLGTGVRLTNVATAGEHSILLVVSDGQASATNHFSFTVMTREQAVAVLVLHVEQLLPTRNNQPLLASLNAAIRSFQRGVPGAGLNELKAVEHKIRAQVATFDASVAEQLLQAVDRLSNVLKFGPM